MTSDLFSKKIAVIGGGVAGLTAAYLLARKYQVFLFEKNNYIGGHTNTIRIPSGPDEGLAVDTGFIVYNEKNYPLFTRLLAQLQVEGQDSDMSFAYRCQQTGFEYSSYFPQGLFAQKRNLVSLSFWGMIFDILQFNQKAIHDLDKNGLENLTLRQYLKKVGCRSYFIHNYLIPMGAAIWSTSPQEMDNFPAEMFVRFFYNHGLLALKGRPQWKTVVGGSQTYVRKILESLKGCFQVRQKISNIRREKEGVVVQTEEGEKIFDYVVLAVHADEALQMLSDPSEAEKALLGTWSYTRNLAVLHQDISFLPKNENARASWNYIRETGEAGEQRVTLTYDMNRLQRLKTSHPYLVTLNPSREIAKEKIIREVEYTHPRYTFQALRSQAGLMRLSGENRTFYCGSYMRYGFHEDAVKSAVQVAEHFGITL